MISNGALNGNALGDYPLNGGGYAIEAEGQSASAAALAGSLTVRRMAVASAVVTLQGEWLSLTGFAVAKVRVAGGLAVRKRTRGKASSKVTAKCGATRSPVASASFAASVSASAAAVRIPIPIGVAELAIDTAGEILRRPIANGQSTMIADTTGKALRRPTATAAIAIVLGHLAQAGYLYFRPTDRRRIVTVLERRQTQISADYRTIPIHADPRKINIPREASN